MISKAISTVDSYNLNCCDDELVLNELKNTCSILKAEIENKIVLKESLLVLVKENENIGKSLLQARKDYKNQESDLLKTLFLIQVNAEKQKILSRKKLNEFNTKQTEVKEKIKKLPLQTELEDLKNCNEVLLQDIKKFSDQFENTKRQYEKMWKKLSNNFRKTVCEFGDTMLKIQKKKVFSYLF